MRYDIGMAKQRVVVEVHLRIQREDVIVGGEDQAD